MRERGLVCQGTAPGVAGRPCHVFRSVEPGDAARHSSLTVRFWQLDAETHLVASVGTLMSSYGGRRSYSMEFTYTGVNQPIPEEVFRPPSGAGKPIARKETDPTKEAYTAPLVGRVARGVDRHDDGPDDSGLHAPLPRRQRRQRRQQRQDRAPLGDERAEGDGGQRTELKHSPGASSGHAVFAGDPLSRVRQR